MGNPWFGSKAASGLRQALIALMPPHSVYIETHLGGGALMRPVAAGRIVSAFDGDRERARHVAVRVDADTGVGAVPHQHPDKRRRRSGTATAMHRLGCEFRVCFNHRAHCRHVTRTRGHNEPLAPAQDAACCRPGPVPK